ncbi:C6 transcription factor [Penicillium brasilianum]|uniref:C6 transcription factor n=1 Tax=Penicillium brasilianum TaxID=104259 RepID=A0A1S9RG75_PENBI|nr:C6 transcription factor [Penicillium brasilianum]
MNSKRKNVRTACATCKRRKLKCTGQVPCPNCVKTGASCAIDEYGDQRRKHVLKRKLDSLDEKGHLLDRLIVTLQESDRTYAAQITNLIRSHASLDEIRAFMDDLMERPRLEKTPDLVEACHSIQQWHESQKRAIRARSEPKQLSDMALFRVPAHPWTSITEDDDFVSHLISLWFTWAHPFLNWIDIDLFIRDMQSGNVDSEFCSPFLVNIILADACAYSDYPEAYAIAAEQWSRGLHFYKEAKRYFEKDVGKGKIVTLQGMGVLYLCTCMIGRDRIGWRYLGDLAYGVHELAERRGQTPEDADQETMRKLKATDHTIWGLFTLASMSALSYQKPAPIKVPQIPYPLLGRNVHREKWSNYPLQSETTKAHTQCLSKALYDVSLITHDLTWCLFKRRDEEQTLNAKFVQQAEDAYNRLRTWYDKLPNCLGTSNATPHVLSLHLKYHTIIQTIFGVLKDLPKVEDCNESAEWLSETRQRAQERCIESALASGDLIDIHCDLWGLDQMPPVNVQWVTVSMFTLLPLLEDEEKNRKAFTSLSIAAKSFSNRWSLGKGMLRLFQVTSKQMEIKLPPETDALYTDFETNAWSREDRKILNSQYPNFINSMKGGQVDDIELDMFLTKFDDLYLEDDDDDAQGSELFD